jgi:DNA-directed RNA polymerase specialized sigma24 family protein
LFSVEESCEAMSPFPLTKWTAVETAGSDSEASQIALGSLVNNYRRPLLHHLRTKFQANEEDAEDWVQAFLEQKVLTTKLLAKAKRNRGKFRTFLLNTLDNFVNDKLRRDRRQLRCPEGGWASFEEVEELIEDRSQEDRETEDWALSVVEQTVSRMREVCERESDIIRWAVFKERTLDPILEGTLPTPYENLVQRFGFKSPDEASNCLITGKRMFRRILEEVVAQYVGSDAETEIRELRRLLTGGNL